MGFRINTNIAAMNAHTNSVRNNRDLDNSLSRLSSGLRINTAADDSSGLAIANSLRNQASSLGQAIANGNDAVGLLQTADGALSEYSTILDTIKTKAVQAASDGQNEDSRAAIQRDIDALMEELNVIANTTSFNGQKLLSGTFSNKEFQMGAQADQSVRVNIGSTETSQIGQTTRATMEINKLGDNQLTLRSAKTGEDITLDPFSIEYNNDATNGLGNVADMINKYSGTTGITAKAVVEVETGTISAGTTDADFSINGINIGSVQVLANDETGTLQNAINSKTIETGVSATRTSDGRLELSSSDGRAIQISGTNLDAILGKENHEMSTTGYLDIVQAGSSDFQITGVQLGAATGNDVNLTGTMGTVEDSVLTVGSIIGSGSTLAAGTEVGASMTITLNMSLAGASSTADMTAAKGSILASGSIINKDTLLTTDMTMKSTVALSSDMLIAAGSTLASGTTFDSGTVIEQDITVAGVTYKAGSTLTKDLTLDADVTLTKDMTMFVDVDGTDGAGADIASASILAAGTLLGMDVTITGTTTLDDAMVLKEGSVLVTGSSLDEGSILGQSVIVSADITTTAEMVLKEGSTLSSASILDEGSTIGGIATLGTSLTANKDMLLKEGSVLASGSTLEQGTVLMQDLTADQVDNGNGTGLKAGTVLGSDLTITADIVLTEDMILTEDSIALAGSKIAANTGNGNSVEIDNKEFTSLADIDVTTLEGAMNAMDTLDAAIANLDAIRSGIGSAQNQIVSTINNISVTQVNVKAAESQLRDVDFAAESATFAKHNILAQSGSYAMSQANAVQQNVMRLLQ